MDAKSKANFINSVASGEKIPCPECGQLNKSDSKFCSFCGCEIKSPEEVKPADSAFPTVAPEQPAAVSAFPAAAPAESPADSAPASSAPAFEKTKEAPVKEEPYVEPPTAFAQGLPEWTIEPPQVVVRRH